MRNEIKWLVNDKVLLIKVNGDVTVERVQDTSAQVLELLESTPSNAIHIMVDETNQGRMIRSLKLFSSAGEFIKHPKVNWLIVFGNEDPIANFLAAALAGLARVQYRRVATLDEARRFVEKIDLSLSEVKGNDSGSMSSNS